MLYTGVKGVYCQLRVGAPATSRPRLLKWGLWEGMGRVTTIGENEDASTLVHPVQKPPLVPSNPPRGTQGVQRRGWLPIRS